MALDIKFDPIGMNILSDAGFIQHLYQACRLRPGSGCLVAPVCSSFVFMILRIKSKLFLQYVSGEVSVLPTCSGLSCTPKEPSQLPPTFNLGYLRSRGSTKRSSVNPEGDVSAPSVRDGNIILCRTLVVLYICAALKVWWVLEQPKGSVMQDHPAMQFFIKQISCFRHYIAMEDYGAPTQKPTWLYSSCLSMGCGVSTLYKAMRDVFYWVCSSFPPTTGLGHCRV